MSRQVYRCPTHGEFEREVPVGWDVPKTTQCYTEVECECIHMGYNHPCDELCVWVPSAPNFIGGPTTGAQKE